MRKAVVTGAALLITAFGGATAFGAAAAPPGSNYGYAYYPEDTSQWTTVSSPTVEVK